MPNYTGIHHVVFVTRDMDQTIRFWRDLLEMRLVGGIGDRHMRQYFFEISAHDLLAFFEWPGAAPIDIKDHGVPAKRPVAFDHIAISVDCDDELWTIRDRLEAAGFWVSEVIDHGFIHSIYSFDPNNIPIEFSCPVHGVDIRRRPLMVDRNPTPAATEGADPVRGYWPAVTKPTPFAERRIFPGEGIRLAGREEEQADKESS